MPADIDYLRTLQFEEHVTETTWGCNFGHEGVIVKSVVRDDAFAVLWEDGMQTAITHGTRRLKHAVRIVGLIFRLI